MNNDKNRRTEQQQQEQNTNTNINTPNLLTAMKAIQQNLQEINTTLGNLNQRITTIEKRVGIKTPVAQTIGTTPTNTGKPNEQDIVTVSAKLQDNKVILPINSNPWSKPINSFQGNQNATNPSILKRKDFNANVPRIHKRAHFSTSSSESESESSKANKGKNSAKPAQQPANNGNDTKIMDIKATQNRLENQVNGIAQQLESLIAVISNLA